MKKELSKAEIRNAIEGVLMEESTMSPEVAGGIGAKVTNLLFPKTLADYPAGWKEGQRGSLDGMWADVWFSEHEESHLRIISAGHWDPMNRTAMVYWPGNDKEAAEDEVPIERVVPRFDLQRAWTDNGMPAGEVDNV